MKSRPAKLSNTYSAPEEFERLHVRPKPGRTLIVGSLVVPGRADRRLLYDDAVGVDMRAGIGVDRLIDLEEGYPVDLGTFDHVECISVLEHSRRPWLLAGHIERLMKPGATLHLTVPLVWWPHNHPSDYWRMTIEGVRSVFPGINWVNLCYGHLTLTQDHKPPCVWVKGMRYFARTEVFGFGVKR